MDWVHSSAYLSIQGYCTYIIDREAVSIITRDKSSLYNIKVLIKDSQYYLFNYLGSYTLELLNCYQYYFWIVIFFGINLNLSVMGYDVSIS